MEICGNRMQPSFTTREFDEYTEEIKTKYTIVGFIEGHIFGDKIKNPIWVIIENDNIFLIVLCNNSKIFTKLCPESYKKIIDFEKMHNKKITWYVCTNGYVYGTFNCSSYGIHQIIMNLYRHENRDLSVDHIDRDPLNNTISNLRIATIKEQNNNQKGVIPGTKRERQYQARDLPEGIIQEDMPKYITYNVNIWDKEKDKMRDFFRIEGHPSLMTKIWEGTKSMKLSIQEKLKQAKKVLQDIDDGILPINKDRELPKYVYFSVINEKPYLIYDNRSNGRTKRMQIKDTEFDINNLLKRKKQVYLLNSYIIKKFGESDSILPEDYEYCGEQIYDYELNEIDLPKYVSLYNERGISILAFHRVYNETNLNKKIKLPHNYIDFENPSATLLEDIELTLSILNNEIIKKFGKEYSIISLSDEAINEINKEQIVNGFPMYSRIQIFSGEEYLVFNRVIDKKRLYTTMKLPHNYNKNKELYEFNKKIIELYGKDYELNLTDYNYEQSEKKINIPENMYIVINCKTPYMFIHKTNQTFKYKLPIRYDLQTEINTFFKNIELYSPLENKSAQDYKIIENEWKPKNISLIQKGGKPTLAYQKRINDCKHGISILLPNEPFNLEIYLLEMNKRIITKYGKEHSIFYEPNSI